MKWVIFLDFVGVAETAEALAASMAVSESTATAATLW